MKIEHFSLGHIYKIKFMSIHSNKKIPKPEDSIDQNHLILIFNRKIQKEEKKKKMKLEKDKPIFKIQNSN